MDKKTLIIGNWKLHKTVSESIRLVTALKNQLSGKQECDIAVAPSFVSLHPVEIALSDTSIALAAQQVSLYDQGAYTGEVSAHMLLDIHCQYVLVGHSERRTHFHETDDVVASKLQKVLEFEMKPVLCIGEPIDVREKGQALPYLDAQLQKALRGISAQRMLDVEIAYEPIWAIGTGKTASVQDIQEVHVFLRSRLTDLYDKALARHTRLLYGGSVKPNNASEILACPDVNGLLVGGASLDAESFQAIIEAV
jgi:triosephosphate isomerase